MTTQNCRDCRHHRVELSIVPQIVVCSVRDGQLSCGTCMEASDTGQWQFASGSIVCPRCNALQAIPRIGDWRDGCCGMQSQDVIVPLQGQIGTCHEIAAIVPQVVQRGLFD